MFAAKHTAKRAAPCTAKSVPHMPAVCSAMRVSLDEVLLQLQPPLIILSMVLLLLQLLDGLVHRKCGVVGPLK